MPQVWYDRPASDWLSALPLGNGRLGAMCWGGPDGERIGLNHELAWSGPLGGPEISTPPDSPQRVARARELTLAGQYRPAEELLAGVAVPHTQAYLPVGDLFVHCLPALGKGPGSGDPEYRRGLDLETATAWVTRQWPEVLVRQQTRVSHPAGALLHSVTSTGIAGDLNALLDVEIRLESALRQNKIRTRWDAGIADLTGWLELPWDVAPWRPGQDEDPIRWGEADADRTREVVLCVLVSTDGQVEVAADRLRVRAASWAEIVLTAEVTGSPLDRRSQPNRERRGELAASQAQARARLAIDRGPVALNAEHQGDIADAMGGFSLDLDGTPAASPTDALVANPHRTPAEQRGLVELLVSHARYLLVSGSRAGTLPLTLQGLWNAELQPPWSSNYTVNINLPMAYWPAEAFGLAGCHQPLLDLTRRLTVTGAEAAREVYGLRGWTVHHNTDLWGQARPVGGGWVDPAWSSWPLGGAWLSQHLWENVRHASDPGTAAEAARPVIAGAVRFCLDWLVELPDGSLGTAPSTSPENTWLGPDGKPVSIGLSSTCDLMLITGLFRSYLGLLAVLGETEDPLAVEAGAALARIPSPGIGSRGELLEWRQAAPEAEPDHRHTSHLVGLYPLQLIDPERTPELARAAARTLELRGPESTGWALAWRICLWARLRRPDQVADLLTRALRPATAPSWPTEPLPPTTAVGPKMLFRGGLYPNLFSAHPPFQLDGNLGLAAGVLEALVQSEEDRLLLLPALPHAWPDGRVTGLHTRAGVVLDLTWADGHPVEVALRALRTAQLTIHFTGWKQPLGPFTVTPGKPLTPILP
jgi:alpha-L-fucosidase 2